MCLCAASAKRQNKGGILKENKRKKPREREKNHGVENGEGKLKSLNIYLILPGK
jgi:hypothetical protein